MKSSFPHSDRSGRIPLNPSDRLLCGIALFNLGSARLGFLQELRPKTFFGSYSAAVSADSSRVQRIALLVSALRTADSAPHT